MLPFRCSPCPAPYSVRLHRFGVFNPKTYMFIEKCRLYTGNVNSVTSEDSKSAFHIVEMFDLCSKVYFVACGVVDVGFKTC